MFYVNFLLFLNILHLSFLQQKLITFLSIGFKSMSIKRTIIYSVFLISFATSVSFLNLNLAFKSVDKSPVDAGLRLGLHETLRRRHGRLLSASCASDLCPVTTGNCHHFKYYWIIFTMSLLFLYKKTLQPKVHYIATSSNAAVIGITETKLDNTVYDSEVTVDGYNNIVRKDKNRHGGGVTCYIRKNICFNRKACVSDNTENIFTDLLFPKTKPISVGIT